MRLRPLKATPKRASPAGYPPRRRVSPHLLPLLVALASIGAAQDTPAATFRASAQTVYPPAHALALPRSTFPRWMSVRGDAVTDETAQVATRLHTASFTSLNRVEGFLQTARWRLQTGSGRTSHAMEIQYQASIFATPDGAAAAYADARASLWELGFARRERILNAPVFEIDERDGHRDDTVLLQQGPIEAELRLRYLGALDARSVASGLWYLWHTSNAAARLTGRIASSLPAPAPATAAPTPQLYVSPLDTGPIVKSPSLLTLDATQLPTGTPLDPGAFRPQDGPPLAPRSAHHPVVVPAPALSRYVRTAAPTGGLLYQSAALFGSVGAATSAFDALVSANDGQQSLQPYSFPTGPGYPAGGAGLGVAGHFTLLDASRAWKRDGEVIIVLRLQNLVVVLAQTGQTSSFMASLAEHLASAVPTWLHGQGTDILDAAGARVRLQCLNWYGAEQQDFVVGGLDFQPYETILQTIKRLGYNCVRLPFSNQLVEQNPAVSAHLSANPELAGLHALDILDRIIQYAGALGLRVILDDHRSEAGWSAEDNGLWYTQEYPDASFVHDWVTMAQRYAVNDVVIGADLRNEPHGTATWGDGNPATDWLAAAQRAGNAVLAVSPHLLVVVEGIQYYGSSGSYWWGGNLLGVATAPVELHFSDGSSAHSQLVYSPHDYGPDNCAAACSWFNATTTYDSLAQLWTRFWGYILADPTRPYTAPVWIGEFGTCNYQQSCVTDTTPGSQGQWFSSLLRYIQERHLGWAYWSANGTQSTGGTRVYGALDWYGYLTQDWSAPRPFLDSALHSIQDTGAPSTG